MKLKDITGSHPSRVDESKWTSMWVSVEVHRWKSVHRGGGIHLIQRLEEGNVRLSKPVVRF